MKKGHEMPGGEVRRKKGKEVEVETKRKKKEGAKLSERATMAPLGGEGKKDRKETFQFVFFLFKLRRTCARSQALGPSSSNENKRGSNDWTKQRINSEKKRKRKRWAILIYLSIVVLFSFLSLSAFVLTSRFSRCSGTPAATPKSASELPETDEAYERAETISEEKSVVVEEAAVDVDEDEEESREEHPDVVADAPPRARAARVRNIACVSLMWCELSLSFARWREKKTRKKEAIEFFFFFEEREREREKNENEKTSTSTKKRKQHVVEVFFPSLRQKKKRSFSFSPMRNTRSRTAAARRRNGTISLH